MSLVSDTIARIRNDFPGLSATGRLPSQRDLARMYGVSRPTISAAVRILAENGEIVVEAKRRMRLPSAPQPEFRSSLSPTDRVYDHVIRGIGNGIWAFGDQLPKLSALSSELHVSNRAVSEAYRLLIEKGIALRQGKKTVLHDSRGIRGFREKRKTGHPVILIISGKPGSWPGVCKSSRTAPFGEMFSNEAHTRGIRLRGASPSEGGNNKRDDFFSSVREMVSEAGPHYLGALVVSKREEFSNPTEIFQFLNRFERPVVWFDRIDQGLLPREKNLSVNRCYYSEVAVVDTALNFLVASGHRKAVFPFESNVSWHRERSALLKEISADLPIEIVTYRIPPMENWFTPQSSGLLDTLGQLYENGPAIIVKLLDTFAANRDRIIDTAGFTGERYESADSYFESFVVFSIAFLENPSTVSERFLADARLIWTARELLPALCDSGVTALIAPNDLIARTYLRWFEQVGIRIPQDFSVLSFDHRWRYDLVPLTTVDFGFGNLGRKAFHLVTKAIPIPTNRHGEVAVEPFVEDGGSVRDLT